MRELFCCLLIVSIFPRVFGQPQRDTTVSSTANGASSSVSVTSLSINGSGTCPSRTVNYITHRLPQQCLRTDRVAVNNTNPSNGSSDPGDVVAGLANVTEVSSILGNATLTMIRGESATGSSPTIASPSTAIVSISTSTSGATPTESLLENEKTADETDTESPLDNAKFLSFEEWKRQNLAKPAEQIRDPREYAERQRPGINNALDGFGEDGEIDLDFAGFGTPDDGPRQPRPAYRPKGDPVSGQNPSTSQTVRSKDAGKTCKERTNYASFDCAATILKNNPECKSASSVLVENKDSYMLNKCSAKNKFFVVELCDQILVDTVVLANYEFFSSIFRHFRVSVSDTYPAKPDKWRDLGTFEARNTREIQAFLIEHPQIWARYLRIEFLTHYGSEYYCPVSLLRVHGTTMLEDMRAQEEMSQTESEAEPVLEGTHSDAEEASQALPLVTDELHSTLQASTSSETEAVTAKETSAGEALPKASLHAQGELLNRTPAEAGPSMSKQKTTDVFAQLLSLDLASETCPSPASGEASAPASADTAVSSASEPSSRLERHVSRTSSVTASVANASASTNATDTHTPTLESNAQEDVNATMSGKATVAENPMGNVTSAVNTNSTKESGTATASSTLSSPGAESNSSFRTSTPPASAPAPPQPSTQESFFKSIHKRLQQLESNSTLSLQYIEEQSRILRDAFSKVEKRQISATTSFLSNLNETVMQELHGFRAAYDQLWQSTVIELEGQREQYQREMLALSSRLTLVADELVWQKRMGIVQSTLLLLCLGLVLFARGSNTNGYLEVPLMQQMMNKSFRNRAGWDSPLVSPSPDSRSPVSLFRRRPWRSVTEPSAATDADGAASGTDSRPQTRDGSSAMDIHVEPPTPPSSTSVDGGEVWEDADERGALLAPRESQSGPATPRGTREQEIAGRILDTG